MNLKTKQFAARSLKNFKNIMLRTGPSTEHKKAWLDVEQFLMLRCNLFFLSLTVFWLLDFIFDLNPIQMT